jgi:vancomycin resistance protein YoaR
LRIAPVRIVVVVAVLAAAVAVGLSIALWSFSRGDRICRDVTISSVWVGGMTKAQARDRLETWSRARANRVVTLTALGARWKGTPKDLGARVDVDGAVSRAFAVGRTGSILQRLRCILTSGGDGKHFQAEFLTDSAKVGKAIGEVAARVDRPHRNARMIVVGGRLHVKPEGSGIRVNREKSLAEVSRALRTGLAVVPLPVEVVRPEVTSRDAASITTLLARYTTSFNPGKVGRTHNLRLAANSISGIILKPGMEFSANEAIGPREMSRGYRNAIIFVRGRMEEGLGGGTCQVSSTLYNAVLLAGLDVLQRGHHSRTVPYVPPGLDATVAYGLVDFKFRNSNSAPIALISTIRGSRLTVDIYGSPADKKKIKVYSVRSRRIPAGAKTVVDKSLAPGVRRLVEPASAGVSATVYREITNPDGTVTKEVVSRDRYAPQDAIIAVGPPVRAARAFGSASPSAE